MRLIPILRLWLLPLSISLPNLASAGPVESFWDGGAGNWTTPARWSTNPNYPQNGSGIFYNANISSGSVTLDQAITIQRLRLTGGTLLGPSSLTLNDGLTWSAGTVGGNASVILPSGSTSTVQGSAALLLDAGLISNAGTLTVGSNLTLQNGGMLENLANGIVNLNASIGPPAGPDPLAGTVSNAGTIVSSGETINTTFHNSGVVQGGINVGGGGTSSGSFTGGPVFFIFFNGNVFPSPTFSLTNGATMDDARVRAAVSVSGNVSIQSLTVGDLSFQQLGSLQVNASSVLTAGSMTQNGGSIMFNDGTVVVGGGAGTLSSARGWVGGSGTLNGNLNVQRTFSPTNMSVSGNLSFVGTFSTFDIGIGGPLQGEDYSFVSVGGQAALPTVLQLRMTDGFELQLTADQIFTILTSSSSITSGFTNVANGERLQTVDGLASFQVNYGPDSAFGAQNVVLSHGVAIPEPATWAMLFLGGTFLIVMRKVATSRQPDLTRPGSSCWSFGGRADESGNFGRGSYAIR